ncbi:MAG: putative DNA binding domain-containing protein [Firmicutes bacterium]|nr:putative DNA binding domain-containing protein [Bacillota bacterium]
MLDFSKLEQYRENNRIEAKRALGGLPKSIWETYSAFANTMGGVILLGVEEHKDGSLHAIDLPQPEKLARVFWRQLNDTQKASVNILSRRQVQIRNAGGKRIVAIFVPRAQRLDRPVFVDGDPLSGVYRRSGEGDYRCNKEEVAAMLRDAARQTPDMQPLPAMDASVFHGESVARYRNRLRQLRPGQAWEDLDDGAFLCRLGAAVSGENGEIHPTAAGLLLLGKGEEIVKAFPGYSLEYEDLTREPALRILSAAGDWSGNVYDFYQRVSHSMDGRRHAAAVDSDAADAAKALREALINCLVNADYYGRQGVTIRHEATGFVFANPGAFRVAVEAAQSGGVSDPRNAALSKMFHVLHIGDGDGDGLAAIYAAWQRHGWPPPLIEESFEPERITLFLSFDKDGKRRRVLGRHKKTALAHMRKRLVVDYLTEHPSAKVPAVAQYLSLRPALVRRLLKELAAEDIVTAERRRGGAVYRLKA